MPETPREIVTRVLRDGPDAVVVDSDGTLARPDLAKSRDGVETTVIFFKEDGTSVGASSYYARVAQGLDRWYGFVRTNELTGTLFTDFVHVDQGGKQQ